MSATPAMINHGMDAVRQAVEFLNPGQLSVTTFDQPLFARAKTKLYSRDGQTLMAREFMWLC